MRLGNIISWFTVNHDDEKCLQEDPKSPDKDTEFFERVKNETKHELLKDKIYDRVKNQRQPASDEVITRVQYADALERKDQEIASLKEEIVTLKQELFTVKSRNKKLCNILGQGESKFVDILFMVLIQVVEVDDVIFTLCYGENATQPTSEQENDLAAQLIPPSCILLSEGIASWRFHSYTYGTKYLYCLQIIAPGLGVGECKNLYL